MTKTANKIISSGKTAYIGAVFQRKSTLEFHVGVWRIVTGPKVSDYSIVQIYDEGVTKFMLVFSSEPKKIAYESWFAAYSLRYNKAGDVHTMYAPSAQEGEFMSGYPINCTPSTGMRGDVFFYDWCWIVANTTDLTIHVNGSWLFSNKADMILFKLQGVKKPKNPIKNFTQSIDDDDDAYDHSLDAEDVDDYDIPF